MAYRTHLKSSAEQPWVITRAVQRSILSVIADQSVEPAGGISIARVGHVGDVVRAHDVGGETADSSKDAGVPPHRYEAEVESTREAGRE